VGLFNPTRINLSHKWLIGALCSLFFLRDSLLSSIFCELGVIVYMIDDVGESSQENQ